MLNFYDFEIFRNDWLVVVVNPCNQSELVIVNDKDELARLYDERKNEIWVGYNNCHYDQYIFKSILLGLDPYWVSDQIIRADRPGWSISDAFRSLPMINYDTALRIDRGLKVLEAYMGHDIEETSVPFDIGRKLTTAEIEETVKYCRHDVDETMEVFGRRKNEFTAKMDLLKMFDFPLAFLSKSGAQLTAMILGAKQPPQPRGDDFDFEPLPCIDMGPFGWVRDWYMDAEHHDYSDSISFDLCGCPHICAWGGIHGALPQYSARGYFINVDVESFYPAQMIVHGFLSRNVHDPAKFTWIRDHRLELKHAGDDRQKALKVVINGTYGASKDPHNGLFDPRQANQVCVNGQLMLIDLMWHLSQVGAEIIQSNTDGVLLKMPDDFAGGPDAFFETVDDVAHEWEHRTGMSLEFDEYVAVHQKDVNNYVLVTADGHVKGKGAYVKSLSDLDYDMAVVNRAVVEFLCHGTAVAHTINACSALRDFQHVVKVSGKYAYAVHGSRCMDGKCFRVFASRRQTDGQIGRVKSGKSTPEKFANTSDHVFIDNCDITDAPVPDYLDRGWYIDLANERLRQFGAIS